MSELRLNLHDLAFAIERDLCGESARPRLNRYRSVRGSLSTGAGEFLRELIVEDPRYANPTRRASINDA